MYLGINSLEDVSRGLALYAMIATTKFLYIFENDGM
uniref:Uncharacterized protein n=1 Tax=Rhizophora mucronata TaxID=61149 RepID=A0A2P2IHE7_RHIMU